MELALIILAVAVVAAALILAFAPRPARGCGPPAPDPRLDTVLSGQGDIAGQFRPTVAAQAALQRTLAERHRRAGKAAGRKPGRQRHQKTGETSPASPSG